MKLVKTRKNIKQVLKNNLFKNMVIYTLLFCVLAFIMVYIFKINGKNFIWNNPDGMKQHILTLFSYTNVIKNFISTGGFNTFTWNIGFGIDMFANYAYYIIGDLFSYLALLVPEENIFSFYSVLVLIRLYFVGITFLVYCNYHKLNNIYSVIGALMYAFCAYNIYASVRHPYFTNALIILPLLFLAVERAIKEEKYLFYTIMIAILFIMSFYFGYMLAIIIAIYGILLTITTQYQKELNIKSNIKKIIKKLLIILGHSFLGIGISAFVLFPTLVQFINSERSGNLTVYPYTISYYRNLINNLISPSSVSNWVVWGTQSIIFVTLPIFIRKRKQQSSIFFLLIILLIPLLISQVGSIFDGFSYPNNRWSFVFPFLFSFITVWVLSNFEEFDKKDKIGIFIFVVIFLMADFIFEISLTKYVIFEFLLLLACICALLIKNKRFSSLLILVIIMVGIGYELYYKYDVAGNSYVNDFINSSLFTETLETSYNTIEDFDDAVEYIKSIDTSFYRIAKYPYDYENISLYYDYNSIGSYYSITPSIVSEISYDLGNSNYYLVNGLKEFDYRTKILSLLGEKYIITPDESYVPYGYSLVEDYVGSSKIYVNDNYTNFATLYTSYITTKDYENLTSLEKETILLEQVALDDSVLENYDLETSSVNDTSEIVTELDYELTDKYHILDGNTITITSTSQNKIILKIDDYEDREIYVSIKEITYEPFSSEELIANNIGEETTEYDIRKAEYSYKWYQPSYKYYINVSSNNTAKSVEIKDYKTSAYYIYKEEYLINLGYNSIQDGTITISLSKIGTYTFDSIEVYAVSMDGYEEDIDTLNESNFELIEYDDNYMIATVNPTSDGVLQFATYYNDGWDVYVDGEEIETFESNTYFLGIYITEGEHTIELRYHTPYVKTGLIISGVCLVSTIAIHIVVKKRKKKEILDNK